jgi:hypothetical protein
MCICFGLSAGSCIYRSAADYETIHIVLSSRNSDSGAAGNWTWQFSVPSGHQFWQRNFIPIQVQDERGRYWYAGVIAAEDLDWISNGADRTGESDPFVHFIVDRPSGDWDFQGTRDAGGATGKFVFRANNRFAAEVEAIGGFRPDIDDLIKLSFSNATLDGLHQYKAAGLMLDTGSWLRLINHGVSPDYASDMKRALDGIDVDVLIECRNYGMTADFASGYSDAGYTFDYEQLIRLRNYGVQPEFSAELRRGGMMLDAEQLTRLHNYGLQPAYVLRVRELGFGNAVEDIIKLRNYGVPEDFLADVKYSGYDLSIDEIVKLRNYGVPAGFLESVKRSGYSFTLDEIIKLRNYGITEEFLSDILVPGRRPLSADAIIDLRSRGVSAETIRALRAE